MKKQWLKIAAICAFGLQVGTAAATSVAYVGSCSSGAYLSSYGYSVTQVDNPTGTGYLAGFDAAVVSSNCAFSDATGLGNELKSFADAGHGVVLAEFAFQGMWQVLGGINQHGYNPFINDPLSSGYNNSVLLGTIFDPSSPLFAGLSTAAVTNDYNADVGLDAGATLVADWNNGRHAIAFNSLGSSSVVGLNFFPSDGFFINTDTEQLVANAIAFSLNAHGGNVPEPATLALLGFGLVGLRAIRRRQTA